MVMADLLAFILLESLLLGRGTFLAYRGVCPYRPELRPCEAKGARL